MSPKVEYRGGIPELQKTGLTVANAFPDHLSVSSTGFSFKGYKIPYSQIIDVSLVSEGIRNKSYVLNVEYELADGFKSCVVLTGKEVSQLYSSLQKARQKYLQRHPSKSTVEKTSAPVANSVDVAAEIEKFHNLKEKGIITEEEFNAAKNKLLGL